MTSYAGKDIVEDLAFLYSGGTQHHHGVCLVPSRTARSLKSWEPISEDYSLLGSSDSNVSVRMSRSRFECPANTDHELIVARLAIDLCAVRASR